eukprot:gb/GECG01015191.1/.p1 GENE.gb/GECG01015191.1/~~gb/GECG01015191.1/.p1  ORF type:complete len:479 (+),score=46.89 gb/GECG01015191.1/:1-1437(+)
MASANRLSVTLVLWLFAIWTSDCIQANQPETVDIREDIIESAFQYNDLCIEYDESKKSFRQTCDNVWPGHVYISLHYGELFDGNDHLIHLDGIDDFEGLFTTNHASVVSLRDAPLIMRVHTRNGSTSYTGGFIVQSNQQFFRVANCSSSGLINGWHMVNGDGEGGGGICGQQCGQNGGFRISYSYSTAEIYGGRAGGIVGQRAAKDGFAEIFRCHSTGDILGYNAGGICGAVTGRRGRVLIQQSYSTGLIGGTGSGGICGASAALESEGNVNISECSSHGDISTFFCGGICGQSAAAFGGSCTVSDSYSTGGIRGEMSGGIFGGTAGANGGTVVVLNTYSSGRMALNIHGNATLGRGIIGAIDSGIFELPDLVDVRHSVYNGEGVNPIADITTDPFKGKGNSASIINITGRLYSVNGVQLWSDEKWIVPSEDALPVLRFQYSSSEPRTFPSTPYRGKQVVKRTIRISKSKRHDTPQLG